MHYVWKKIPDLLAELLKAESLLRSGTIMIGDRARDLLGAKANGIFAVGALWGFGSRKELAEAGADLLCGTPADLIENLDAGNFKWRYSSVPLFRSRITESVQWPVAISR